MTLEMVGRARDGADRRLRATPLARRIAQAHSVDLAAVVGTGRDGRICAADVRALVEPDTKRVAPSPGHPVTRSSGHPVIRSPGHPVTRSPERASAPIATVTFEVDVTRALGAGAGLAAAVVAAAGALLPAHPELNGAWGDEAIVLRRRAHIAVGEAGPDGLRWAVVRDAGDLTARGVARALAAGAGGEATFAVVGLGAGASWQSAAPPLPGTAAALCVGAPARTAVASGDAVVVRTMATLTLSYDARLLDHGRAAAFLRDLRARLEGAPAAPAPVL